MPDRLPALPRRLPAQAPQAAASLAGLLALSDWLFLGHPAGLSLAVFAGAAFAASLALRPADAPPPVGPLALMALGVLPVVEHVQPLSVLFLLGATVTAVAWAQGAPRDATRLLGAMAFAAPRDALRALAMAPASAERAPVSRLAATWALPVGGALVLTAFILQANPLAARWLAVEPDVDLWIGRAVLWTGIALMCWPLLTGVPPRAARAVRARGLPGVSPASISRALVVFNAILAVQSATDAAILWGGASLPDGLSWAEYAHRGAYPLLATALLAIPFSLAARPHLGSSRLLHALLFLWLAQNLMLTASAGLRLAAYVEAFGFTHLRLHAAVWMATVAAGLILALWQVVAERSTGWLVRREAALGLGVLWACCFVNFAALVAAGNLARGREIDWYHLCALPRTAHAAIAAAGNPAHCRLRAPTTRGWRDWDFRDQRVRSMLAAMEAGR